MVHLKSKASPAYVEEFIRVLAGKPIHLPLTKERGKRARVRKAGNVVANRKPRAARA